MNADANQARTRPGRRVVTALLLSVLTMGVGHIYAGRGTKGAALYALTCLSAPLMILIAYLAPSESLLYAFMAIPVVFLLIYLYAILDSAFAARRAERPYVLKTYNNVGLYVGLIVLGLIISVGGTTIVRAVAFEAFRLPTNSMRPTFVPGDRILANKQTFDPDAPRRGQLIVFHQTTDDGTRAFIKRIVGLPGETIRIEKGDIYIDGEKLKAERIDSAQDQDEYPAWSAYREKGSGGWYHVHRPPDASAQPDMPFEVNVPHGTVFVLGDNRQWSRDSRNFGPVPVHNVIGVAQYRFFPIDRWGVVR